jgi:hypothetical protein
VIMAVSVNAIFKSNYLPNMMRFLRWEKRMKMNKWTKALQLAREINKHTGSCWNTGGTEICERCFSLARKLVAETSREAGRRKANGK